MHKHEAILQLNSTVVNINESYDADTDTTTITCLDENGNEVTIDLDAVQTLMDSKAYIDNRRDEYPPIGDQLDMIWHLIDSGGTLDKTSDFYTSIKVVKDAHPKS